MNQLYPSYVKSLVFFLFFHGIKKKGFPFYFPRFFLQFLRFFTAKKKESSAGKYKKKDSRHSD